MMSCIWKSKSSKYHCSPIRASCSKRNIRDSGVYTSDPVMTALTITTSSERAQARVNSIVLFALLRSCICTSLSTCPQRVKRITRQRRILFGQLGQHCLYLRPRAPRRKSMHRQSQPKSLCGASTAPGAGYLLLLRPAGIHWRTFAANMRGTPDRFADVLDSSQFYPARRPRFVAITKMSWATAAY
ncbi:hypothetical protein GA0061105_105406 [Rhizobium aethiopicum]|uniref:Uncharacterized protein n=1 Tax=Rhizobium aethiopicum TaxID=1138170 RepID=A0A1C3Y391_9HYPH|nr:hypothetical protein GA0061105_105406 [Rhizobium aethiopicum]